MKIDLKYLLFFILCMSVYQPISHARPDDMASAYEVQSAASGNSKLSSFKESKNGRSEFGNTGEEQVIQHTNMTVDDTTDNEDVEVQQKDEWKETNTIKVINNLGSSSASRIYSADQLPNKFGGAIVKKGITEVPEGATARISGTETEILPSIAQSNQVSSETPTPVKSPQNDPKSTSKSRVLVS